MKASDLPPEIQTFICKFIEVELNCKGKDLGLLSFSGGMLVPTEDIPKGLLLKGVV